MISNLAVALYNRADHLPKRTCLGCGGCCYELTDGRRVSTDCTPHGARVGSARFTWAQIAAAVPKQDGLGL